jgi:DNA-binding transcriptional LysR family regulator
LQLDRIYAPYAGVQPLPPEVRARVVAVEPLVLALRRGHPLSRRKTITLDALRDEPMITLVPGSGLRTVLENACQHAGFTPRITAETGELASFVGLAAEGLGVAVVPRSAVEGADVAVVRITRPRLQRRTALAWNEASISPARRAFITLAGRHFASVEPDRSAAG